MHNIVVQRWNSPRLYTGKIRGISADFVSIRHKIRGFCKCTVVVNTSTAEVAFIFIMTLLWD